MIPGILLVLVLAMLVLSLLRSAAEALANPFVFLAAVTGCALLYLERNGHIAELSQRWFWGLVLGVPTAILLLHLSMESQREAAQRRAEHQHEALQRDLMRAQIRALDAASKGTAP